MRGRRAGVKRRALRDAAADGPAAEGPLRVLLVPPGRFCRFAGQVRRADRRASRHGESHNNIILRERKRGAITKEQYGRAGARRRTRSLFWTRAIFRREPQRRAPSASP
eukprot:gene16022-6396_t